MRDEIEPVRFTQAGRCVGAGSGRAHRTATARDRPGENGNRESESACPGRNAKRCPPGMDFGITPLWSPWSLW